MTEAASLDPGNKHFASDLLPATARTQVTDKE